MNRLINYSPKKSLTPTQRLSLISLTVLMTVILPFILPFNLIKVSRANFPVTPPVTPPTTPPITPTPTIPTVAPTPNFPPIFSGSRQLPAGIVSRKYKAEIKGYDWNPQDKLTMKVQNPPPGIYLESCRNVATGTKSLITCSLSGVPQKKGIYKITILLSDDKGGNAKKEFTLRIIKAP